MRNSIKKLVALSLVVSLTSSIGIYNIHGFSTENASHIQIPGVTSTVSNRVIAFHGNSTPGYTTIVVKTDRPSRGHINVNGNNNVSTRINLSSVEFKTEHIVHWSPWNESTRQPLAVGEYILNMDLQYENFDRSSGIGLGKITVVNEPNPKALVEGVRISPTTITPSKSTSGQNANIDFVLNRHAEIQLVATKDSGVIYAGPKTNLSPGNQRLSWNGLNTSGEFVADGEYQLSIRYVELTYNNRKPNPDSINLGNVRIEGNQTTIPSTRMEQIVTGGGFDNSIVTPNSNGNNDTVGGWITLSEPATVTVWITTAVGTHMNQVIETSQLPAGTHHFNWNAREFMGGTALNGKYKLKVTLTQKEFQGELFVKGAEVTVRDSFEITVPQPVENVRVTKPTANMNVYPVSQGYVAKEGDVFPVLRFDSSSNRYEVLVVQGVPGFINASDVEKVGSQTQITHTVVAGDTLWLIASRYQTTVNAITTANNLDPNKHLLVGQKLVIPSNTQQPAPTPVQPSPTTPSNEVVHVVVSGDTLWRISQRYNTTVDELVRINNLNLNAHLTIGQRILITPGQTPAPQPGNQHSITYAVKSGDTLWKIAQAHGTTVDTIVKANNLDVSKHLFIGQQLIIPQQGQQQPQPQQPVIYTVKAGDTLWRIAQSNNTTVDAIGTLNNINPNNPIMVGQQIRVR